MMSANETGRLFFAALILLGSLTLAWMASAAPQSARALETTLLAPCCYGGTLDVHDSPIARDLRLEIEDRVRRGESTASIEADMVSRYGPQIRAMPNPDAFSVTIGVAMALIATAAILVFLVVGRRKRKDLRPVNTASRDAYDDRIDAELDALD